MMNQRPEVSDAEIAAAFKMLGDRLQENILRNGKTGFIGPKEIMGEVLESYQKSIDALSDFSSSNKKPGDVVDALLSNAMRSMWGVISVMSLIRKKP